MWAASALLALASSSFAQTLTTLPGSVYKPGQYELRVEVVEYRGAKDKQGEKSGYSQLFDGSTVFQSIAPDSGQMNILASKQMTILSSKNEGQYIAKCHKNLNAKAETVDIKEEVVCYKDNLITGMSAMVMDTQRVGVGIQKMVGIQQIEAAGVSIQLPKLSILIFQALYHKTARA